MPNQITTPHSPSQTRHPADAPHYLWELCASLKGDKKFIIDMINIFLEDTPNTVLLMEKAVFHRDWEKVHFEAHKLKTSVAIMGFSELGLKLSQMETDARQQQNVAAMPSLFFQVKKQMKMAAIKLEQEKCSLLST